MKKLVFSISLILSYTFIAIAGVVKSIPAKADDFTNGNIVTITPSISDTDLNTYNNALQVLEYLRQGGTIDFSNVSNDYEAGDLLEEFVDLIDTVGSGIDYYGNNFLNNIFDLSSDTVQLSPNTKLKDRIGQFRSNLPSYLNNKSESPTPTPNPDSNYLQYLNYINPPFFIQSQSITRPVPAYIVNSYQNYSFFCTFVSSGNQANPNGLFYNSTSNIGTMTSTYIDVYINFDSSTNKYIVTHGNISPVRGFHYYYGNSDYYTPYLNIRRATDGYTMNGSQNLTDQQISTWEYSYLNGQFDTLEYALDWVRGRYANINLYVNGNLWLLAGNTTNYSIELGSGTFLEGTNQSIEYYFDIPVYVNISDLIDKIDLAIDNKINLDFPYLEDLIVDTNGQQTIAVTVFSEDYTIDDLYVKDYGAIIPLFPLWVEYPVSLEHINTVATVGIVDVIPADIIEVLGIFLVVGLFVFLCHRLME